DHRGLRSGHHRDADRGVAAGNRPVDPGDLGTGVDGLPGRPGVDHLAADQLLVPFHQRRRHPRPAGRPAGPGRAAPGLPGRCRAVGVLAVRYALHRDLTSAFAAVLVGAYGLGAYASPVRRYARWLGWLSLAAAVVVVVTSNGAANKPHGGVLEGRLAGAPLAL